MRARSKHPGSLGVGGGITNEIRPGTIEVRRAEGLQAVHSSELLAGIACREFEGGVQCVEQFAHQHRGRKPRVVL